MSKKKKERKNLMDLEPPPTEPDPVVQAIAAPEAGAHLRRRGTRDRSWDRRHRTYTYKIPADFHDRALIVRKIIKGLAQQYQSTMDDVARALMTAAIAAVREGEIRLDYRPNPQGRKMTVEVVREGGWPQEELPNPTGRKKAKPPVVLNFRWGQDTHQALSKLAGEAPKGAVVVLLLEAALDQIKAGKWGFRPIALTAKQTVTVATSWKNKG